MSKKIFVTKGALMNMIKRLVKEAADPAFITEPPVASPPIETDPRAEQQVDQGMLPVEDPEWEPATQEELANAVAQYISQTPEKELGDVWNDIKTTVDDAVERGDDDETTILEITKRHGRAAGIFAAYLLEAKDDDWDMGMQGWDPGDEYEEAPFDEFGTDVDLRDAADDPEATAAAQQDIEADAVTKRAARMKRRPDEQDLSDTELIKKRDKESVDRKAARREIGSFWKQPLPPAIEKYFVELGQPVPPEKSKEWNKVYRFMRNKSINVREKLRFIATLDDVEWEGYLDDATDQWLDLARDYFSGRELAVVANNPNILYDLVTYKSILNDVIIRAMFNKLASHGYAGGKTVPKDAEALLGFRGWKDAELERTGVNPYKATAAANRYRRQLGKKVKTGVTRPKKAVETSVDQAAKRGTSAAGLTEYSPEALERMLKHAKATGHTKMQAWAEAQLAKFAEK